MRRTLAVLVATAAFLAPGSAAFASNGSHEPGKANASCNNGKGGNGAEFNGHGSSGKGKDCGKTPSGPTLPSPPPPPA